jgi:hypothetical protein
VADHINHPRDQIGLGTKSPRSSRSAMEATSLPEVRITRVGIRQACT